MTYSQSAEGITITRERALQELRKHSIDEVDYAAFFEELGDKATYQTEDVLGWLGY